MKKVFIIAAVLAIIGGFVYFFTRKKDESNTGEKEPETKTPDILPVTVTPPTQQQQTQTLSPVSGDGKALVDGMVTQIMGNSADKAAALQKYGVDKSQLFEGMPSQLVSKMSGREYALPLTPSQNAVAQRGSNLQRVPNDLWDAVGKLLSLRQDFTGGDIFPDFDASNDANKFVDQVLCPIAGGCPNNNKKRNEKVKGGPSDTVVNGIKRFFANYLQLDKAANTAVTNYAIHKLKNAGYNFPVNI